MFERKPMVICMSNFYLCSLDNFKTRNLGGINIGFHKSTVICACFSDNSILFNIASFFCINLYQLIITVKLVIMSLLIVLPNCSYSPSVDNENQEIMFAQVHML